MSKILSLDMAFGRTGHVGYGYINLYVQPEDWLWGAWELNGLNFKMRCHDLCHHIEEHGLDDFEELLIEWPTFYNSEKGETAARQDTTLYLAGIAMFVAGYFQVAAKDLHIITAPMWKGNVAKEVTARRFLKLFGEEYKRTDHNAIDAIMMLYKFCELRAAGKTLGVSS